MKTNLMMRIKLKSLIEASIGFFSSVCPQKNDAKLKYEPKIAAEKGQCKVPIFIGTNDGED